MRSLQPLLRLFDDSKLFPDSEDTSARLLNVTAVTRGGLQTLSELSERWHLHPPKGTNGPFASFLTLLVPSDEPDLGESGEDPQSSGLRSHEENTDSFAESAPPGSPSDIPIRKPIRHPCATSQEGTRTVEVETIDERQPTAKPKPVSLALARKRDSWLFLPPKKKKRPNSLPQRTFPRPEAHVTLISHRLNRN